MGNRLICCRQNWIELNDAEEKIYFDNYAVKEANHPSVDTDLSENSFTRNDRYARFFLYNKNNFEYRRFSSNPYHTSIQHISDREPEENEYDPSLNPSYHALFYSGFNFKNSGSCFAGVSNSFQSDCNHCEGPNYNVNLKKWSSCSSVSIGDGYLFYPNLPDILWCVAVAVSLLSSSEFNSDLSIPLMTLGNEDPINAWSNIYSDMYKNFDDRLYPVESNSSTENNETQTSELPNVEEIRQFLRKLFSTALLGPECAIVSVIFLERLVNGAELAILPWSWRRQLLACVLLASKVLDDQAVWNVDYCQILRNVCVEDLNALERHTLSLLQFNIDVPLAVYARYYFDLLAVGEAAGLANRERQRLTLDKARQFRLLPEAPELDATTESSSYQTGFWLDMPRHSKVNSKKRTTSSSAYGQRNNPNLNHICIPADHSENFAINLPKAKKQVTPVTSVQHQSFNKTPFPVLRSRISDPNSTTRKIESISDLGQQLMQSTVPPPSPAIATDYLCSPLNLGREFDCDDGPIELDSETEFINCPFPDTSYSFAKSKHKPAIIHTQPNSQATFSYTKFDSCQSDVNHLHHNHTSISKMPIATTRMNNGKHLTENIHIDSNNRTFQNHTSHPLETYNSQSIIDESNRTDTPNHAGFIRSIVGGEVAYSLLRDAGIY